jgi:predicted acyl esterase
MLGANNGLSNGAPASEALLLQWFDQYLMGIDTGAAALPNVTQVIDGYGPFGITRYASTTDWPHPKAKPVRMYLHGNLSLSTKAPVTAEATHRVSEPNPASIVTGVSSNGSMVTVKVTLNDGSDCSINELQWSLGLNLLLPSRCTGSDKSVETTQNALLYQTPTLWSDLYINGPIEADIWMSTTATEAALSVRVDDVDLFGNVTPLTNGLQAASYRAVDPSRSRYINGVMIQPWHPFTEASLLPVIPGKPMLVPVEIFPAAALVRAGHRLRIAISASNQAQGVWTNPQLANAKGNVTTIYNSPTYPSSVVLPVVPVSDLP